MLKRLMRFFGLGLAEGDLGTEILDQEQIADSLVGEPVEDPAGAEPAEELADEPTLEAEPAEGDLQEDDADWLPTEQERVWPDETLERFAQGRYPELLKMMQAPGTPAALRQQARQILHDKLNDSMEIQRLSQEGLEPELEEEVVEPQAQQLPTREEYFNQLTQAVKQRTDPQVAKDFFTRFNKVFGLTDQQIQATLKANPNAATEFTEVFSLYGLNLINTFADQLIWSHIGQQLEQVFPGFQDMHARSSNIMAWDRVRNSQEAYSKLPQYGTKEFSTKARSAATRYFGSDEDFENAQFTKVVNGQRVQLTPLENAQKKYGILAKIMAGQAVDPRLIQQAVRTGAKGARRQTLQRTAGKLGTGTTRAQAAPRDGEDDLFTEGLKLYRQEHGSL